MKPKTRYSSRSALIAVAAVWACGITAGSWLMLRHEYGQGASAPAPERLPADSQLALPFRDRTLTLVVAVHPDCPCTGATLEQLDRFLTKNPQSAQVLALFWVEDSDSPPLALQRNPYWQRIGKMESATAAIDPQGARAAQFGALVSGAVAAYDQTGSLRFQGGLTSSRGHAGPSRGLNMLEAILRDEPTADTNNAPSFGCSLEG